MFKRLRQVFVGICLLLCLTACGENGGYPSNTGYETDNADISNDEKALQDFELEESDLKYFGEGIAENSDIDTENSAVLEYSGAELLNEAGKSGTDDETLEVHYIDVGQGDSILITQGETTMLIDAGNNDKGTTVWSYLLSQDVDVLDYAICTHPDADHIGGMDVVLYKLDCDTIFMPACEHDTETYRDLIQTIGQRNQQVVVPKKGEYYSLGNAQFQILTDTEKRYGDNKNDYSLAIRLTFGETSFLFTGDAEEEAEQDMISSGLVLGSDVYKVAHHGATWANTEAFLTAVNPTYAVISCGEGNSYGHPRAEVLNTLRGMGVNVFRTDEQGTIVVVSDGEKITFSCSPSTTWQAGEPMGSGAQDEEDGVADYKLDFNTDSSKDNWEDKSSAQTEQDVGNSVAGVGSTQGRYVLNTNSKKFHYPDCNSVGKMSDKNKAYSEQSREELIAQGYEPCGNCEP